MIIGIYGGTFDPIHFGHINLAVNLIETKKIDEVWFCPALINPHKLHTTPTPIHDRLAMLTLALQDVPHCRIIDIETKKQTPSYTLHTLQDILKDAEPNQEFYLILGDDAIPGFFQWHQPEEIVKLVKILVGRRLKSSLSSDDLKGHPEICNAIKNGFTSTRIMDISSTDIRERIRNGLYCGHLVPEKVLDYIYKNQLYSNN